MFNSLSSEHINTTVHFELDQQKLSGFRFHRPKTQFRLCRARERKHATCLGKKVSGFSRCLQETFHDSCPLKLCFSSFFQSKHCCGWGQMVSVWSLFDHWHVYLYNIFLLHEALPAWWFIFSNNACLMTIGVPLDVKPALWHLLIKFSQNLNILIQICLFICLLFLSKPIMVFGGKSEEIDAKVVKIYCSEEEILSLRTTLSYPTPFSVSHHHSFPFLCLLNSLSSPPLLSVRPSHRLTVCPSSPLSVAPLLPSSPQSVGSSSPLLSTLCRSLPSSLSLSVSPFPPLLLSYLCRSRSPPLFHLSSICIYIKPLYPPLRLFYYTFLSSSTLLSS